MDKSRRKLCKRLILGGLSVGRNTYRDIGENTYFDIGRNTYRGTKNTIPLRSRATPRRREKVQHKQTFHWTVFDGAGSLFSTPLCSKAFTSFWSLLNRSRAAVGVKTRRHVGCCVAVCGFCGFGSSRRVVQNSILMVWPSKLNAWMESEKVSLIAGLSAKRVWTRCSFCMSKISLLAIHISKLSWTMLSQWLSILLKEYFQFFIWWTRRKSNSLSLPRKRESITP